MPSPSYLIPSFRTLRRLKAIDDVRATILGTMGAAGLPVTSWERNSLPTLLVEGMSIIGADVFSVVGDITAGAYGDTAAELDDEAWMAVWAYDRFGLVHEPERFAAGIFKGVDTSGSGQSIAAGGLIVADDATSTVTYTATANVTIPANGAASIPMIASAAGSHFNIPSNTPLRLVSSFPGLVVSNPPQAGTETWLTTAGADRESNRSLYGRCRLQWHELSVATPAGFYASRLRKLVPTITKVRIDEENPRGPFTVDAICATGAGPASGSDIVAAQSLLRTIRSVGGDMPLARAAVAKAAPLGGIAYVRAASLATARGGVARDLTALQRDLPIGGTVYASELIRIVQSKSGVRNFVPASGLNDTTASPDEVVSLLHEIQYVGE